MRPTVAEIVLPALRHNLSLIRERVRAVSPPATPDLPAREGAAEIIAVVKADAYGHGAVVVARELVRQGVEWLAVACLEEAVELGEAGISSRLIILGPLLAEEIPEGLERGFIPVLSSLDDLARFSSLARTPLFTETTRRFPVILDVDTGMGRMGFLPEQMPAVVESLRELPALSVIGLFSHFPVAESWEEENQAYTRRQIEDFRLLVAGLRKSFPELRLISLANSGGIFFHPDSIWNAVRPGITLYGVRPAAELAEPAGLWPVMRWVTEIVAVRDLPAGASVSYGRKTILSRPSRIALLPVGYADGLCRNLPPGFRFLVQGQPAPLLGVVTMDFTLIDVTDLPHARPGARVLLLGRESRVPCGERKTGERSAVIPEEVMEVRAEDHAKAGGTIPYVILTAVGKRVPRVLKEE